MKKSLEDFGSLQRRSWVIKLILMSYHKPVLLEECIEGLKINPNGIYVDVTFGGGGHSNEILKSLDNGMLYI